MELPKEIRDFFKKMNDKGIPLPVVRDPETGKGSVSLTLVFLSSIWVQLSLIGKVVTWLGGLDAESAIYWFLSCAALYWGRKLSGSKNSAELSNKVDNPDQSS